MDDNRRKALDAALSQIERQFGKGAVTDIRKVYILPFPGVNLF